MASDVGGVSLGARGLELAVASARRDDGFVEPDDGGVTRRARRAGLGARVFESHDVVFTRHDGVFEPCARVVARCGGVFEPRARVVARCGGVFEPRARVVTRCDGVVAPRACVAARRDGDFARRGDGDNPATKKIPQAIQPLGVTMYDFSSPDGEWEIELGLWL